MAHCSFFTFAQAWLDCASFARRCVGARRQVEQDEHQAESGGQQRRRAFVPAGEPPHGLASLCAGPVFFSRGKNRALFPACLSSRAAEPS